MLTRCIFCHRSFEPGHELEHLPAGRRIAFDPARGRLWCICTSCQGWTLMPIEQRWEALEELERKTRDRAKLLIQGENIALLRAGSLDLIRIGRAPLREEAWWRYGNEFVRRQDRAKRIKKRGKVIEAVGWMALFGVPIWTDAYADWWLNRARRKSFGRIAWSGATRCQRCGRARRSLLFYELRDVHVLGDLTRPVLGVPCVCRGEPSLLRVEGPAASHTLRRLLAYHNFGGAARVEVEQAAGLIERSDHPRAMIERLLPLQRSLAVLDRSAMLTLEIALNHEVERELLTLEVAQLEARWREEENIAAIADRELS